MPDVPDVQLRQPTPHVYELRKRETRLLHVLSDTDEQPDPQGWCSPCSSSPQPVPSRRYHQVSYLFLFLLVLLFLLLLLVLFLPSLFLLWSFSPTTSSSSPSLPP